MGPLLGILAGAGTWLGANAAAVGAASAVAGAGAAVAGSLRKGPKAPPSQKDTLLNGSATPTATNKNAVTASLINTSPQGLLGTATSARRTLLGG
jgi:hypothetical protein